MAKAPFWPLRNFLWPQFFFDRWLGCDPFQSFRSIRLLVTVAGAVAGGPLINIQISHFLFIE